MKKENTKKTPAKKKSAANVSDDVYTAIAMALYEATSMPHDEEHRCSPLNVLIARLRHGQ